MSKRRLSKQQKLRVEALKNQQKQDITDSNMPTQLGLVIAQHGKYADVRHASEIIHCKLRQNLGRIVVGDKVFFQKADAHHGVVTNIETRKSKFWQLDDRGNEKIIAANVNQIYIVVAPTPEPSWLLIDSYLAAAKILDIPATIIFNKSDLSDIQFKNQMMLYQALGLNCLSTSNKNNQGITELKTMMKNQCCVLVGQSGVGKSSLIQTLIPEESLAVGDLHQTTGLGTHTTSTSRLYELENGGQLIDSPGVREFKLWPMDAIALSQAFVEFIPFLSHCKFRNCTHQHEPDCAIQKAVLDKKIAVSRLHHYHELLEKFRGYN